MDRAVFFQEARQHPFGGKMSAGQVAGCTAILDAWDAHAPASDPRWIAYALATSYWETAQTMQPIAEIGKGRGRAYGVPAGPYHQIFFGRGLVQLTWLKGYAHATDELRALGILGKMDDLTRTPDLAMRPDVAASIMIFGMCRGWFTGRKLADYFAGTRSDWVDARAIINGKDQAAKIAGFGLLFYHALQVATAPAQAA